jgi:hypothetical protein
LKIGIFWYDQDRVIGIAHHFDQNDADSLGLIDSDYNHVQYWEKLRVENSHLQYIEYEEIPRGRVIFNTKKAQPMIQSYLKPLLRRKLQCSSSSILIRLFGKKIRITVQSDSKKF